MGLGTTAGIVVMALALLPALHRAHVHLRYLPAFRHPAVVTLVRVSGWTVGYVIANQIALFVVTVLGNGTSGGPFVYVTAYAFFQLPHGLLAVSLATTFAPELAIVASRGDLTAFRAQLSRGLRLTAIVVAPAAAIYLGLARPIVVALLERGAFSAHDAVQVADTLAAFSVGLLPFSLYLFALRAFTSRLDTRTPFLINCVENVVNIVLAFPLYAWLGIPGLALAFSLAYFVGAGVAFFVLHRDLDGIDGRRLASTVARAVVAAAAVAGVTWAIARGIGSSGTGEAILATVLGVAAGAALYLGLLVLFRVDELRILATLLPRATCPSHARVTITPWASAWSPTAPAIFRHRSWRRSRSRSSRSRSASVRRSSSTRWSCRRRSSGTASSAPTNCRRPRRRRPVRSRRATATSWNAARPGSCASTSRRISRARCSRRRSRRPPSPRSARCRSSTRRARRWDRATCVSPPHGALPTATRLESIVAEVVDRRDRTKLYATLDTLDHIRKSGRIGNARALLGSMLSIKPIIEIKEGVVEEVAKVRTRSKALKELASKAAEQKIEHLAVLHGNAPDLDGVARPPRPDLPA